MPEWANTLLGNIEFRGNLALFVLNIVVTSGTAIGSVRLYEKRKNNERAYQLELSLFQQLVVGKVDEFMRLGNALEEAGNTLLRSCLERLNRGEATREEVEAAVEEIDRAYEELSTGAVLMSGIFSQKFRTEAENLITKFYDSCTDIFSKLDVATITPDHQKRFVLKLGELRKEYHSEITKLVRRSQPDHR